MKMFENVTFSPKTFEQVTLEKFSAVVWRCSRYLQGPSSIALHSRKKITTIRLLDKKIFKKNQNLESKKNSILHTTVVFGRLKIHFWKKKARAHLRALGAQNLENGSSKSSKIAIFHDFSHFHDNIARAKVRACQLFYSIWIYLIAKNIFAPWIM